MIWLRALLLCLVPLAAMGQQRDEDEGPSVGLIDPIEQCLDTGRSVLPALPEGCLGTHARACVQWPGNQSTARMERCYLEELRAWNSLLNRYFRERPGGARGQALVEVQRAWLRYRDRACGYFNTHDEGGSMARIMGAQCMLELTARRTAVLRFFHR